MAQPAKFIIDYRGALKVKANVTYTSEDIPDDMDVLELRSNEKVSVAINGTVAFPLEKGMLNYINADSSYTFTENCIVAYGVIVDIS